MIRVHFLCSNLYGVPRACELAVHHHSRILDAVKAKDTERARRAMEDHLALSRQALEDLDASLEKAEKLTFLPAVSAAQRKRQKWHRK